MGYPPLDLLKKSDHPGMEFESRKQQMIEYGVGGITDLTVSEYINFLLSPDLMNPDYHGKYSDINRLFWLNLSSLADSLGLKDLRPLLDGTYDPRTEWRDIFLSPVLWEKWAKNKQVFKPDKDFADALFHTRNLQISKWQVKHLPVKDFYIDLSDCNGFAPIVGILVSVTETPSGDGMYISEYLLTEDLVFFSFYTGGQYNKDGLILVSESFGQMERRTYTVVNPKMEHLPDYDDPVVYKKEKDRTDVSLFGIEMVAYLSLNEPDIIEDKATKATYRPSNIVRNKFSEVRRWEVGVRFGSTIRTTIKETKQKLEAAEKEEDKKLPKVRKSPVPHFRCAHWQHYWVGQGRKQCIVRWIEPVFVGFADGQETKVDAVIHRIK